MASVTGTNGVLRSGSIQADKSTTVQDFIAMRNSDELTYYNYSILQLLNGYEMFITNVIYDYEDEINDSAVTVTLTDVEKYKYRYKPWLLAYDIYGSRELQFIIMMLNNIIDPKEFDFDKVRLISYSNLTSIISRINTANDKYLQNRKADLKDEIKNASDSELNSIWIE